MIDERIALNELTPVTPILGADGTSAVLVCGFCAAKEHVTDFIENRFRVQAADRHGMTVTLFRHEPLCPWISTLLPSLYEHRHVIEVLATLRIPVGNGAVCTVGDPVEALRALRDLVILLAPLWQHEDVLGALVGEKER